MKYQHNITFSTFLAFKNVLYICNLILQFSFLAESNFRGWIISRIYEKPRNTQKIPARKKIPVYSSGEFSTELCQTLTLYPS